MIYQFSNQAAGQKSAFAIENAMRSKQLADIEELLKGPEQIEPELKIRVYDQQGKAFPNAIGYAYASDFLERLHVALNDDTDDQFFIWKQPPNTLPRFCLYKILRVKDWAFWCLYAHSMNRAMTWTLPSVIL